LLSGYLKNEGGAITVDWTVLTGALVGMGLAVLVLVAGGTEALSRSIGAMLAGIINDTEGLLYFGGFDDGPGGWSNGRTTDGSDFGAVLGPFAGSNGAIATESTFQIPQGAEVASFTFDMIAVDSWDDERFIVFVDGVAAASLNFNHNADGITGQWVSDNPDYSFEVLSVGARGPAGYNSGWPDQSATVRLDVANPGGSVSLGFGSTLNQGLSDESFAIDNVSLEVN
jgi:hypothetical protein